MVDKIVATTLNCSYGKVHSIKQLNLTVFQNEILGIIGPANSGKTTFLRTINRLNDMLPGFSATGTLTIDGADIFAMDPEALRRKVGMVFALPLPLPMTVYDNVAYGPRRHGITDKKEIAEIVERALCASSLWEEVKDRLNESCLLYTSPSPRDGLLSRMPSSA